MRDLLDIGARIAGTFGVRTWVFIAVAVVAAAFLGATIGMIAASLVGR